MGEREEAREMAAPFWKQHREIWEASGGTELTEMLNMKVLQLTTVGRSSGEERWVLLTHQPHDEGWVVVASNLGADEDPNWWKNLLANDGKGTVTVDGETHPIEARELTGAERDEQFARFVEAHADYEKYVEWTDRPIPVVLLARAS